MYQKLAFKNKPWETFIGVNSVIFLTFPCNISNKWINCNVNDLCNFI